MWASRAHGMTYDRTERQQNRIATWASRAHDMKSQCVKLRFLEGAKKY